MDHSDNPVDGSLGGHQIIQGSQHFVFQHNGGTVVFLGGMPQLVRHPHDHAHEFGFGIGLPFFELQELPVKAFVEHYYTTFDGNRGGLASLYQEGSMLTFEGQKTQGSQNIVAKLTSLPFQQCHHPITTINCQPSGVNDCMLVFVSGNLQLAGEHHALKFSQVFHLIPTPQGSYYVLNDIFHWNNA